MEIHDFNEDIREGVIPKIKRDRLDIPEFLYRGESRLDEEDAAILNNVPGNTDIEEMNHLNELESVCQNWKEEEWVRVLYYAPPQLITNEISRRLSAGTEVNECVKSLQGFITQMKM